MKVCIFTTTIDKKNGGPSRSVPILARGLASNGVETTLITCASDNMNLHILDDSSVEVQVIQRDIKERVLEDIILQGKFQLIHTQNLWNPLYHKIAKIARKHSIPYMMTPRGCLEPWCLKQKRIKKQIALTLYQKGDLQKASCILATSDMEATNIRKLGISTPIAVIPNGIDISEYNCRTDISKVKKQICFLSRIHPKKGIEYLIDVWDQLCKSYVDWKIIIAGNGDSDYINFLKNRIKAKGLEKCITIIPPVFGKDKYKLYAESSLFVLPTYSENFGMVIAEAMSCGVPVITTNGTPWQILNEKNIGWCIDLDIDVLRQTLVEAIDSGVEVLFEKGRKSSNLIMENYHYISVGEKMKRVYEWIIGNSPLPECVKY